MHSHTTFLAALALLGFAAASPLDLSARDCPPNNYHTCGDGWKGCCPTSPCYAMNGKSGCPDQGASSSTAISMTLPPTITSSSTSIPSSTAPSNPEDTVWKDQTQCKEDNSDCNWTPTFWGIKTYNETYSHNGTDQFHVAKDDGKDRRRDTIAVFTGLPADRKTCTIGWYKPEKGIYYGTYRSGAMNISTLALGSKTLVEAANGAVNYANVKGLLEKEVFTGGLDLWNWGSVIGGKALTNSVKFECPGKEVAIHFALSDSFEGSVVHDQVLKKGQAHISNGFVQRAGWYLKWE